MSAVPLVPSGFAIEPRWLPSATLRVGLLAGSLLAAALVGALVLLALGEDPLAVYESMVDSSFGSPLAFSQTLVRSAPIVLTAAAVAVAYRMRLYSIGQDGQLIVGAIAASGVALQIGDGMPSAMLIAVVMLAGVVGGVLWAAVPALTRAYLGTNEVLTTLMLNFIAFQLMAYLVIGSSSMWRDVENAATAQAAPIPGGAVLPSIFESADAGIVIAITVVLVVAVLLRTTRWGYELRLTGDSVDAARYAGVGVARNIALVLLLSGGLAGLAGSIQVASVTQALDPQGVDPGLGIGYTGIVVAALARLSVVWCIPVAVLMAALLNAGPSLQLIGVPSSLVIVLQGVLLLCVAGSQFLLSYSVKRVAR